MVSRHQEEDSRYTISVIAHTIGFSKETVHQILTGRWKLRKLCARWVPHLLTSTKRPSTWSAQKKKKKKKKLLKKKI